MAETIAVVAAVISIAGAIITWGQTPRPDFQLLPMYIDDSRWHSPEDEVTATVGIQNQGTGAGRRVALELNSADKWVRTGASDFWPIVAPGKSVSFTAGGLTLDETKRETAKYSKGVGGLADFRGLRVRIQWRDSLGIKRTRAFDLDKEHVKVGRATRLDRSLVNENESAKRGSG